MHVSNKFDKKFLLRKEYEMEKKEFTAGDFLKGLNKYEDTCVSCKFFKPIHDFCKEKKIVVSSGTPKCNKWRYFA